MLACVDGFALGRCDVTQPRLCRGATEIVGQRRRDVRLSLGDEPLDPTQLLQSPFHAAGAAGTEHPAQIRKHAGASGGLQCVNSHRIS